MSDERLPAGVAAALALFVTLAGCTSAARGTAPATASTTVLASSTSAVAVDADTTTTIAITSVPTSTVSSVPATPPPAPATPAPTAAPVATTAASPIALTTTMPPPAPTTVVDDGPRMVLVALASHPSGLECPSVGAITLLLFSWQSADAAQVIVRWADGTFLASGPPASSLAIPHTCAAMPTLYRFYPVAADGTIGAPWNFNV